MPLGKQQNLDSLLRARVEWSRNHFGLSHQPHPVFQRLLLLFIAVPIIEFMVLVAVAKVTSWAFTLAVILLAGLLGTWLVRREGLRCLLAIRRDLAQGRIPADSLIDGLVILVAGTLLITPGLVTDLAGFLLLIPSLRRLVRNYLGQRLRNRILVSTRTGPSKPPHQSDVIDVDFRRVDE